jgi:hypothetical protein
MMQEQRNESYRVQRVRISSALIQIIHFKKIAGSKILSKNKIFIYHPEVGGVHQPRLTAVAGIPTGHCLNYKVFQKLYLDSY